MMDSRIKLRHLRSFLETARLGSLSAAAQDLNISQPAMSKSIRELEDILGTQLFDRSTRRLSLTPAGKVFQQHVGSGMIALRRAQQLVQDAPQQQQRIIVGVLPTAATDLLPNAALQFQTENPDCLMRVSTGPNWLLMSQLREGTLDLVVGRMSTAKVMEGLSFRQLYSERIIAVLRPDHPALRGDGNQSAIGNYPLVVPPPGAVIAPVVRAYLSQLDIPPYAHKFETVSLAFGRKLVQSSDAIWFISRGVVANELAEGTLCVLPLDQDMHGSPVGISMREDGSTTPEQQSLIRALEFVVQNGKPM